MPILGVGTLCGFETGGLSVGRGEGFQARRR